MKRVPVFPPKFFHRLRVSNPKDLDAMITSSGTGNVSAALTLKFKKGHGLVVASWVGFGAAEVKAIGVVVEISAAGKPVVKWTRVLCELPESDEGGPHFWRQETFMFIEKFVKFFKLRELFEKHMPDPFAASRAATP